MFKRLKLGGKLISAFITVAVVVLVVGFVGYWGLDRVAGQTRIVVQTAPLVSAAKELKYLVNKDMQLIMEMLASSDAKQLQENWAKHEATIKEFDLYITGILKGSQVKDGRIFPARDPKLRRIAEQADTFHNDSFQPAIKKVHHFVSQVIQDKSMMASAMDEMRAGFEDVMKLDQELEVAIKDRIREKTAGGAGFLWVEAAKEIKTTMALSRISLIEFTRDADAGAMDKNEKEYRATINQFDGWVNGLLKGGRTRLGVIARVDDPALRKMIEKMNVFHDQHFQKSAERLMDLHRRMTKSIEAMRAADHNGDAVGGKMISILAGVEQGARKSIDQAVADSSTITSQAKLVTTVGVVVGFILAIILGLFSARTITRPLKALAALVGLTAEGDFTSKVKREYTERADEIGDMARDVDRMNLGLSRVMVGVSTASDSVHRSSEEISVGNDSLSDRVQQQASANEETAATIEEMTASVKQNADNASRANELASKTSQAATQGGRVVDEAVQAMSLVSESSHKINDIIDVVNEIAFQTNLLALNASVEAARAGEAGRGFAVVAGEVRNLAQRSADAAKEIQGLIKESVVRVDEGNRLVDKSGQTLRQIIDDVSRLAGAIDEISSSSREQSNAIDQINTAVGELDDITQQNAALVEEMAAASTGMATEAERLANLISRFRFNADNAYTAETTQALPAPEGGETGEEDFF